jgi:folate-binding protein YgfZ
VDAALRARLSDQGAVFEPASGRPLHFGDAARELRAALAACALADRSNLGRAIALGRDVLDLLHRLSTADLKAVGPGYGKPTVLTSPKGRIVARLFVHHLGPEGILLVGGPGSIPGVQAHVGRYTFREDVRWTDATDSWSQFAILGPRCRDAAAAAGLPLPEPHGATEGTLGGGPVWVLGENGSSADGLSVVLPAAQAAAGWETLSRAVAEAGGRAAGDDAVEAWRVLQGWPTNGHELTEEHNPLEAGLRDAVSFTKGCYVGQEVVARLQSRDKVARSLAGFVLTEGTGAPPVGTPVFLDDRSVGTVTSSLVPPGRRAPVAIAYLKREVPADASLRIGDAVVTAVPLPFGDTP